MMLFPCFLITLSALAAFAATSIMRMRPETRKHWEACPRSLILGAILGAVDMAWCVPNAEPVLYIGSKGWLIPLAVVLFLLGVKYLDFLFARALAGFLILSSHYVLAELFASGSRSAIPLSALCAVMGTCGIFLGGMPYLMRNVIRMACDNFKCRTACATATAAASAVLAFYGIIIIKSI